MVWNQAEKGEFIELWSKGALALFIDRYIAFAFQSWKILRLSHLEVINFQIFLKSKPFSFLSRSVTVDLVTLREFVSSCTNVSFLRSTTQNKPGHTFTEGEAETSVQTLYLPENFHFYQINGIETSENKETLCPLMTEFVHTLTQFS